MIHLFLDGSSSSTLVGLTNGPCRILPNRAPSDGMLFQSIQELLDTAGLSFMDLASIAAGKGPGSHTGTRAVAAAAKGLAMGLSKPFKLFPSLLLFLPSTEGIVGTSIATRGEQSYAFAYNTATGQEEFSGLISSKGLEELKLGLDDFGHDYSPHHLTRYLEALPTSHFNESLTYLTFS